MGKTSPWGSNGQIGVLGRKSGLFCRYKGIGAGKDGFVCAAFYLEAKMADDMKLIPMSQRSTLLFAALRAVCREATWFGRQLTREAYTEMRRQEMAAKKFRIGDIVRASCCANTTHWKILSRHKVLPDHFYGVVTGGIGKGTFMGGWADHLILVRRRRKKK